MATVLLCLATTFGKAQVTPAHQVKAAFIYNFAQFVVWPPSAFDGGRAPFIIGILGDNPFGSYLDELVKGEKVSGRPIEIKKFKDAGDVKSCNILFINLPQAAEAARALRDRSILTVSDSDNFAKNGGMVRLFTAGNKIRLQINPAAARAAGIEISAKLLRVADIVQ